MTIQATYEVRENTGGSRSVDGTSLSRRYLAISDTPNDSAEDVIQYFESTLSLVIGTGHPDNVAAKLNNIQPRSPRRVQTSDYSNAVVWDVELDYNTISGGFSDDPVDNDPIIKFSFSQYTVALERAYEDADEDGITNDTQGSPSEAVLTSSLKPFNPPPSQEEANLLIDITINRNSFDPGEARNFKDTINSAAITVAGLSIPQHQGRMRQYGGVSRYKSNGDEYWEVNYQIEVQEKTWVRKFLDRSFYELKTVSGELKSIHIVDAKKQKITEPALLDGSGTPIGPSGSPVFLEYLTYYPADWSTLNLPNSL